jgi:hypothetical protein
MIATFTIVLWYLSSKSDDTPIPKKLGVKPNRISNTINNDINTKLDAN